MNNNPFLCRLARWFLHNVTQLFDACYLPWNITVPCNSNLHQKTRKNVKPFYIMTETIWIWLHDKFYSIVTMKSILSLQFYWQHCTTHIFLLKCILDDRRIRFHYLRRISIWQQLINSSKLLTLRFRISVSR